MKQSFGIFILVLCYYTSAMALTINKDSLIRVAKATTDQSLKAKIYRDLADFYVKGPEEIHYLKLLYQLGKETKNKEVVIRCFDRLGCFIHCNNELRLGVLLYEYNEKGSRCANRKQIPVLHPNEALRSQNQSRKERSERCT